MATRMSASTTRASASRPLASLARGGAATTAAAAAARPYPQPARKRSLARRAIVAPVQAVLGFALPFTGVSAEEREARKAKVRRWERSGHRRENAARSSLPPAHRPRTHALHPSIPSTTPTQLLARIAPLARGATATEEDKADVARLFADLEKANPTKGPLASPLLNGRWKLLYTTSASILGTSRPPFLRPAGPIYQVLSGPDLSAENRETFPFFNRVVAALTPETASRVAVQFRRFFIFGLIPVDAPPTARGKLDVTYLDDDLRLSRGDKGNLFILQMADRADRPAKL